MPPALYDSNTLRYRSEHFERPSPSECINKMEDIAKSEGMVLGGDATNDGLSVIAEHFDCDLRRIVNEMQLFHF